MGAAGDMLLASLYEICPDKERFLKMMIMGMMTVFMVMSMMVIFIMIMIVMMLMPLQINIHTLLFFPMDRHFHMRPGDPTLY